MVASICEVHIVLAVEHDARRLLELTALAAVPAPPREKCARLVVHIDLLRVLLGDVHPVRAVDGDAAGPAQLPVAARTGSAELAVEILLDVYDRYARRRLRPSCDINQPLRVKRRIHRQLEAPSPKHAVRPYRLQIVMPHPNIDLLLRLLCRRHASPTQSP